MITVEVQDKEVMAALSRLAGSVSNMKPALSEIGNTIKESTRLRIASGKQSPDGAPWKPWARSTAATRRKSGKGELMRFNSMLLNSINYRAAENSVEIGTNVKYAAIHQFGGDIQQNAHTRLGSSRRKRTASGRWSKKRVSVSQHARGAYSIHIPARPFLGISGADKTGILKALQKHIAKASHA